MSAWLDTPNKLQDSKLAGEKLQAEHWMQLLIHAESAFVGAGVLEMAEEAQVAARGASGCEKRVRDAK